MNGELKSLGLEDCSCYGEYSIEKWTDLVMLACTLLGVVRWEETSNQFSSWRKVGQKLALTDPRRQMVGEKFATERVFHLKEKAPLLNFY